MLACILYQRKHFSLSVLQSIVFTICLTAIGVAGAKIMYFLESGLQSWGGISFFGSVFLIPVLMPLLGWLFRLKRGQTLDLCAPCVAVMIATLRVNCFLSGCCGGWQVCVGTLCFHWPTQILESLCDVAILHFLLNRKDLQVRMGLGYPWFMLLYGIMRFLIEFLRDTPKDWLMLSHGQWFSACAVLAGGMILLAAKRRKDTNAENS